MYTIITYKNRLYSVKLLTVYWGLFLKWCCSDYLKPIAEEEKRVEEAEKKIREEQERIYKQLAEGTVSFLLFMSMKQQLFQSHVLLLISLSCSLSPLYS